jgi:hypothetical protein
MKKKKGTDKKTKIKWSFFGGWSPKGGTDEEVHQQSRRSAALYSRCPGRTDDVQRKKNMIRLDMMPYYLR